MEMQYRRLGKSGLHVSLLSYGSWVTFSNQIDVGVAQECIQLAYDHGVNFFDNAEVYANGESEIIMGKAIKNLGFTRDSYLVSSKVFWGGEKPTQSGLSRKHIFDACHAALKRLQVDYLDLYFCHRPDIYTPIEETASAMSDLVRQGKVLYWGTSEWSAQAITEAHAFSKANHTIAPTMEQPEYNLFNRTKIESEFLPLYEVFGLGTTIWSPLASGVLTGKYNSAIPQDSRMNVPGYEWLKERYQSPEGVAKIEKAKKLEGLAKKLGVSLTHLALAWCAKNPRVSTVILGASKKTQLSENLKCLEVLPKLTAAVIEEIEAIVDNRPAQPSDYR